MALIRSLIVSYYIYFLLQVNKPYLPLASGEYSVTTGVMIVSSFAILVGLGQRKPREKKNFQQFELYVEFRFSGFIIM